MFYLNVSAWILLSFLNFCYFFLLNLHFPRICFMYLLFPHYFFLLFFLPLSPPPPLYFNFQIVKRALLYDKEDVFTLWTAPECSHIQIRQIHQNLCTTMPKYDSNVGIFLHDHQENMPVKYIPPSTPILYRKTGVCRGIPIFLIFAPKHRLWVLVRTASARRF